MVESKEFKRWHRAETARRLGQTALAEASVEEAMREENLKIEGLTDKGWRLLEL